MVIEKVVLIGPPGAGKSTVGKSLAKLMDLPFIDSDREIERITNRKIAEIFVEDKKFYIKNVDWGSFKEITDAAV